jgi:hypothetical protein
MKRCSRCGVVKERGAFGRSKQTSSGLESWCYQCKREASNQRDRYRQEHAHERELIAEIWGV